MPIKKRVDILSILGVGFLIVSLGTIAYTANTSIQSFGSYAKTSAQHAAKVAAQRAANFQSYVDSQIRRRERASGGACTGWQCVVTPYSQTTSSPNNSGCVSYYTGQGIPSDQASTACATEAPDQTTQHTLDIGSRVNTSNVGSETNTNTGTTHSVDNTTRTNTSNVNSGSQNSLPSLQNATRTNTSNVGSGTSGQSSMEIQSGSSAETTGANSTGVTSGQTKNLTQTVLPSGVTYQQKTSAWCQDAAKTNNQSYSFDPKSGTCLLYTNTPEQNQAQVQNLINSVGKSVGSNTTVTPGVNTTGFVKHNSNLTANTSLTETTGNAVGKSSVVVTFTNTLNNLSKNVPNAIGYAVNNALTSIENAIRINKNLRPPNETNALNSVGQNSSGFGQILNPSNQNGLSTNSHSSGTLSTNQQNANLENFQVFLQYGVDQSQTINNFGISDNIKINDFGGHLFDWGCGPSTAYNILRLEGYNVTFQQVLDSYKWTSIGSSGDGVLLNLKRNGLPTDTVDYGLNNRITDANQLVNYNGILVYDGVASEPQSGSVGHLAAFDCVQGICYSIDSYFSKGSPIKCNIESSELVNCGGVKYQVGTATPGNPNAFYPVKQP